MQIYRPVPPTFIPRPKKEEQALAPLQSTAPIQTRPILPQNLTPESSTSAPKVVFYQDKEGPGLHSLESEYPPNYAGTVGLVPPKFQEREFCMKNGDFVIMKKHSFEFFIAKKKEKKGAKFTLKKIYMSTNNETTKRPLLQILFTLSPGITSIHPKIIRNDTLDALIKRGII